MKKNHSKRQLVGTILIFLLGFIILISSLSVELRYVSTGVSLGYFFDLLLGRYGWSIHFGLILLLIGIFQLKNRYTNESVETTDELTEELNVKTSSTQNLSVMEWFGTLILIAIPLVNLIFLLIWSFGENNPRKNFSLATLLTSVVGFVIAMIAFILTFSSSY